MKSIAIVYKSKYGSTKKYAQWITEEIRGDLFESSEVTTNKLMEYDIIVYGGGLYASGIAGISVITKNFDALKHKDIIIFTVGLGSTNRDEVFHPIINKTFSKDKMEPKSRTFLKSLCS